MPPWFPDLPSVSALALGIFIGFMAWYFIKRFKEYTTDGLTAVIGVLIGGVVVTFLDWTPTAAASGAASATATVDVVHRWWYPIGLLVGFLVWYTAEWKRLGYRPSLTSLEPETPGKGHSGRRQSP